jgi:hypothetical protein
MSKTIKVLSGVLVAVALAACKDPLAVTNTNNPDRLRVLARPSDLEALIAGTYKTAFNGTFGTDGLGPSARTMSWENASNLANWGLGPRSALPRSFIDNSRGNPYQGENQGDFNGLQRAARAAGDGINRLAPTSAGGGGITLGYAAQDARAKAFAWFSLGVALGYVAMDYDSAAIVDPYEDIAVVPPLSGYADVVAAALTALDSALYWTNLGTGTNGFPLPTAWINSNALSGADFTRLIRSYKAYFRANVARTPADRAAVDWALVRDDAAAGITSTLYVTTGSGTGWTIVGNQWWLYQQWGQLNQMIGLQADTTGIYDTWLATPNGSKVQYLIRTPDQRFPSGDTRTTQIANSPAVPAVTAGVPHGEKLYFRNRVSADPDAAPWSSYYDWYRMLAWRNNSNGTGPYPVFTVEQNNLLRAEALIRLADIPGAAALIDVSRTFNGLPALTGVVTTATQPVPGGATCVPRVPDPAQNYTKSICGNIMDAMKWEYRMETMYTSYISQWYAGRGWGDLPEGTPVQWPVPYNEMDTRRESFYNMGGVNNPGGSVGKGNFGF